mmetsp:Transcript_7363/g.11691  ORF Transcript_7363/g.11691 Transcript_7363/m.11691 type:complete len:350 (-) Transcript_7363:130-1179(-)|eukprot:CAMPEP_0184658170 /NCGR_PEP_ID=MMETSP0308-20130426/23892_1 /TAXON_ID=38269 /ORGANISM="Gloeochaete witrockiana, Strain SAG 46.84" /LENGTH=349 /DNA_ID=CAMNT_0027096875 /DNA_START=57 /DNA_END=1106 /DNA_ORIENTATION=-
MTALFSTPSGNVLRNKFIDPRFLVLSSKKTPNSTTSIRRTLSVRAEEVNGNTPSTTESQKVENAFETTTTFAPPPNFVPPEPRRFYVRPDKLAVMLAASISSAFRAGTGAFVQGYTAKIVSEPATEAEYSIPLGSSRIVEYGKLGLRPALPLQMYEFEACPFCRKVREAVNILDLDVIFYPCPRGSEKFRQKAIELGGKSQFPYLVDPNTGVAMYESDDIIQYLFNNYGGPSGVSLFLRMGALTTLTAGLASLPRAGRGGKKVPSRIPETPLEFWGYEASPFVKIVRETLVELEIPYLLHPCVRGSENRKKLISKTGRFQVPYLEDPNTGVKMFESAAIIDYLNATYKV